MAQSTAQVAAENARIRQALAKQQEITVALAQSELRSPFAGIVTRVDARVGETAPINAPALSLIGTGLRVESNIPEADIANVRNDQPATVTLDAYSSDVVFPARVRSVDPAERIIDGVATYRTLLEFSKLDDRIRPGMTANIDITIAVRDNAVAIPARAIYVHDGAKFVKVIRRGQPLEVQVQTGITDPDGNEEIINGIGDGERVVVS